MKICLSILFVLMYAAAFAQPADDCWNDKQRGNTSLTQKQFDSLVGFYSKQLALNKKMDTADYVLIVKLSNTIFFNRRGSSKENCWPEKKSIYEKYSRLCDGKLFFNKLTRYLGVCIPNRGMGCYYSKFNLDWGGGGPNENSLIKVF